jgi:hypothetical protein
VRSVEECRFCGFGVGFRGGGSSCGYAFCGVVFGVGSGNFGNCFLPILPILSKKWRYLLAFFS